MVAFMPVRRVIDGMQQHHTAWRDVLDDLQQASIAPMPGFATRLRYCGAKFEAFIEPGTHDGDEVLWVVGIRPRRAVLATPRELQVVGRDVKRRKSTKSHGSGRRWPTSWGELIRRIEAHPRAEIKHGGKHLSVLLNGKPVQTLPLSASDHRALLNACQILRSVGIDVRR